VRLTSANGAWEDTACNDSEHPFVCEGPVLDARGGCGSGQIAGPDGSCYSFERGGRSFADAKTSCDGMGPGWRLVVIDNATTNDFVTSLINCTPTWLDNPPGGWDDIFFALTILTSGPLLVGRLVRTRSRLNAALHEKALAVEHDRAARAAGAVAEERARIAGELHHLVSDALESMVGQAGAAERLARSKPDVAERAFTSVETTGREALSEIRRMLGVLRRDDEELALAPQPSLAHVRDLVARARAAGLPVELEVEGEAAELPAGVDLTAYRLIQEALGGALAAPDARRATVRLRYGDAEIALEVVDVGDTPPGPERQLLGVRERVAIYHGEVVAEPVDEAGYAVRARLPVERVA